VNSFFVEKIFAFLRLAPMRTLFYGITKSRCMMMSVRVAAISRAKFLLIVVAIIFKF